MNCGCLTPPQNIHYHLFLLLLHSSCRLVIVWFPVSSGLILPSGDINWNCPCLGGMASGPCGSQFKEAFSCFHYSSEEVKGSECIDNFRNMQECMQKYPELYPQEEDKESSSQAESDSGAASAAGTEVSALSPETDATPSTSDPSPDSVSPTDSQTAS